MNSKSVDHAINHGSLDRGELLRTGTVESRGFGRYCAQCHQEIRGEFFGAFSGKQPIISLHTACAGPVIDNISDMVSIFACIPFDEKRRAQNIAYEPPVRRAWNSPTSKVA